MVDMVTAHLIPSLNIEEIKMITWETKCRLFNGDCVIMTNGYFGVSHHWVFILLKEPV